MFVGVAGNRVARSLHGLGDRGIFLDRGAADDPCSEDVVFAHDFQKPPGAAPAAILSLAIVERVDLAIAKYYATEIGSECANLALQVHGGWGFMDDCAPSRYLRDNRVCTIGDGSSQIQTLLIARELGLDVQF